jgi:hypothetical protein
MTTLVYAIVGVFVVSALIVLGAWLFTRGVERSAILRRRIWLGESVWFGACALYGVLQVASGGRGLYFPVCAYFSWLAWKKAKRTKALPE